MFPAKSIDNDESHILKVRWLGYKLRIKLYCNSAFIILRYLPFGWRQTDILHSYNCFICYASTAIYITVGAFQGRI